VTQRRVASGWVSGPLRCTVRTEGGFELAVDEPVSAGGTDQGPQPTDLFLASVASCFTLAIVYAADRMDLALSSVDVDVTADYDGPRFTNVEILARVAGADPAELERIVTSAERVCYVTNTLRRPPSISVVAVMASSESREGG
jgi:putative redox protein